MFKNLCVGILVFLSLNARAFTYFDKSIDYWGDGNSTSEFLSSDKESNKGSFENPNYKDKEHQQSIIRQRDSEKFSWNKYIGQDAIKNVEFWDDGGDYVPPRPFRELAVNPTTQNAENFLKWMNRKNQVTKDVMLAVQNTTTNKPVESNTLSDNVGLQTKNIVQNNVNYSNENSNTNLTESNISQNKQINWHDVQIIYFYMSSCPHCRKEKAVIDQLISLGVNFTPVQIDYGQNTPVYENSIPYNASLRNDFKVHSVPTIYVKYKNNVIYFTSETSFQQIYSAVSSI